MTTLRGWAPCGLRLQAKAPHGHWKTTTFLAALRHDRIDAPWLFDGPIDGESFKTYVEKVLVPTLCPGDIVIMDNLGSHKGKAVHTASTVLPRSASAGACERLTVLKLGVEKWFPREKQYCPTARLV